MPFWDDVYYQRHAFNNKESELQNLSFENYLKAFILSISDSTNYSITTRKVIKAIMKLDDQPYFDRTNLCQIESFIDLIEENALVYTPECSNALKESLTELIPLTEYTDTETLIFGRVLMLQVFELTDDERLFNYKVLNHECMREIVM
ncbi:MAG: hypothetical protein CMB80_09480 [Flammeovirgaceae bacterium]|nr:hypothetical protein [Flammeovirgaceae bacterium]MBR11475.1 hypothetical protein [Rickettsiales bacterium]HCX22113.1 hypothetical protein [Cytophagales bacterium]|tara:strand:- start:1192 stop:1635 length:444 start_codon:yes stop_codon:yes gene_type:complete